MAIEDEIRELANRVMEAAEADDAAAGRACYTEDATLWLNITGQTVNIDDHAQSAAAIRSRVKDLRYVDIVVIPFDQGYVQQHVITGELASGTKLNVPACFVVRVRDGKVAHRDEYVDSAPLAALFA